MMLHRHFDAMREEDKRAETVQKDEEPKVTAQEKPAAEEPKRGRRKTTK